MKKMLCFTTVLLVLVCLGSALAEGVVVIDPSDNTASGSSFEDMKLDEPIDVGDYVFTLQKAEIKGNELIAEIKVFNYLPKTVSFFKDAKVVVTYTGERNTYVFDGKGYHYDSWYQKWVEGEPEIAVRQLTSDYAHFGCTVPSYVIENKGELKMDISYGSMTFTIYFRR